MSIRREGPRLTMVFSVRHAAVTLAGVAAVAIAVLGATAWRRARAASQAGTPDAEWVSGPRVEVPVEGQPSRGPADAPVTIVEFTDYQCPFCRRYARETLPRLLERQAGRVRYVARHFPIPSLNPHALPAAEAAECAYSQGRFWEYHAALFDAGGMLTADRLTALAESAGLAREEFDRCVNQRATRALVGRDILDAWELGVAGTPTFFINGRRVRGVRSLEDMERYIELALERDRG